jgi:hypothetical protein
MTKTKLARHQIRNLNFALQVSKTLTVPAKFRYAITKNIAAIESELKATAEAFPEPDLSKLRANIDEAARKPEAEREDAMQSAQAENKILLESHEQWAKNVEPHMMEVIEIELYKTDLVEIDDTVNVTTENRAKQNQALVEALMPILN